MSDDLKKAYSEMSTERLEELLHLDLLAGGDRLDDETTLAILEVLDERERASGMFNSELKTEELWQEFREEHLPYVGESSPYSDDSIAAVTGEIKTESGDDDFLPAAGTKKTGKQKRSIASMLRVASVALVIGVLLTGVVSVTTYAAGYNIWGVVAQWAGGTFRFISAQESGEPSAPAETPSPAELNGEFSSLQDALDFYNITEPVAPKRLPEGYALVELAADYSASGLVSIFAAYATSSGEITILVEEEDGTPSSVHEVDAGSGSEYQIGEITHYLMTNMGRQVAVWINGKYVVSIFGDLTRDELIDILHSIYE